MTEQTEQTPEQTLVPGSPEYDAAMAAKFQEANDSKASQYPDTEEPAKPEVPEGIPDKFVKEDGTVDYEALAKSYVELEKMRSQKPAANQEEQSSEGGDDAAAVAAEAGLDMETLRAKVIETGQLEDSDYAALEKAGVGRDIVDEYIALRQQEVDRTRAEALDYIGGEEAANDLMQWAAANLSEQEVDAYNGMLAGPQWKAALDTLKTLKGNAKPSANEPRLQSASGSPSGTPTGYTNRDDMKADMANPLYRQNGAEGDRFRAEVQRKMAFASWRRS